MKSCAQKSPIFGISQIEDLQYTLSTCRTIFDGTLKTWKKKQNKDKMKNLTLKLKLQSYRR